MTDPLCSTKRVNITIQYTERNEGGADVVMRMRREGSDTCDAAVIDTTEDAYCIAAGLQMALDRLRGEIHGKNEKD